MREEQLKKFDLIPKATVPKYKRKPKNKKLKRYTVIVEGDTIRTYGLCARSGSSAAIEMASLLMSLTGAKVIDIRYSSDIDGALIIAKANGRRITVTIDRADDED